ncbi:hypothetical protein L218DRAFT_962812 [Marasmius fiardii PR-910]|nr:hypothetical protein L218DRAFT_962812 [Marasmius fiardii PR-910]
MAMQSFNNDNRITASALSVVTEKELLRRLDPLIQQPPPAYASVPDTRNGVSPRSVAESDQSTFERSWDVLRKAVEDHDDDVVRGYKEDIDTLLVFAGLFSAVVTAFAVESYQWLQEDPADTTVALLRQIAQGLHQGNFTSTSSPAQSYAGPTASAIRINTFWFLSLILALVDALFGLLCKQWLREHQRQSTPNTPGKALALRWLRNQSFERWHVPKILSSLPILLELALFSFFAGLMELLWSLNRITFIPASIVVGLALCFYVATTILPGINIFYQALQLHPLLYEGTRLTPTRIAQHLPSIEFVCPYKSPQSWIMFQILSAISRLSGFRHLLHHSLSKTFQADLSANDDLVHDNLIQNSLTRNIHDLSSWSSSDLNVLQRFSKIERCPNIYELMGFRWLVKEVRDVPFMSPHLKNMLSQLPPHLVMPTVFDQWSLTPQNSAAWSVADIEKAMELGPSSTFQCKQDLFNDQSSVQDLSSITQVLYFYHQIAIRSDRLPVKEGTEELWKLVVRNNPKNMSMLPLPFFRIENVMGEPYSEFQGVLEFYKKNWDEVDLGMQVELVHNLADYILSTPVETHLRSPLRTTVLRSEEGLEFFLFLDRDLRKKEQKYMEFEQRWTETLQRICQIHQLPLQGSLVTRFGHLDLTLSLARLKTLLKGSWSTSRSPIPPSLLQPLLHSFKSYQWSNMDEGEQLQLIQTLSDHLLSVPDGVDSRTHKKIMASAFMRSPLAMNFLTSIHHEIVRHGLNYSTHDSLWHHAIQDWVDALERVRVAQGLREDWFKRVPRRSSPGVISFFLPERAFSYTNEDIGTKEPGIYESSLSKPANSGSEIDSNQHRDDPEHVQLPPFTLVSENTRSPTLRTGSRLPTPPPGITGFSGSSGSTSSSDAEPFRLMITSMVSPTELSRMLKEVPAGH